MSSVANALRQRDPELYVIINKATWLACYGRGPELYVITKTRLHRPLVG